MNILPLSSMQISDQVGETREEAINNLKDIIITTFEILKDHDESQLGTEPLRQLRVLEKFVCKIS